MAKDYREIEVKIELSNEQLDSFEQFLKKEGKFDKEVDQKDYYFDNPNNSFIFESSDGIKDFKVSLRVRRIGSGKSFICSKVKKIHALTQKIIDCDEYETTVEDGSTMIELLQVLDYKVHTVVHKTRKTYFLGDFEIAIDKVIDLGTFVEVELMLKDGSTQTGIDRIHNFLKAAGIDSCRMFKRGYVNMLLNPDYDFSEKLDL